MRQSSGIQVSPTSEVCRSVVLRSRPHGAATLDNFEVREQEVPSPTDGEVLTRTLWLSIDPYMRGRMDDSKSYAPSVKLGEPMTGETVGEVVESRHPGFKPGQIVLAARGWRTHSVSPGSALTLIPNEAPYSAHLGQTVEITGNMLISATDTRGVEAELRSLDPATNTWIEPAFGGRGAAEVDRAVQLASAAFEIYSRTAPQRRARFLEQIATNIEDSAATLVARCMEETGLPRARLEGEIAWTAGQLRMFARVVRQGLWRDATIVTHSGLNRPAPDLRMHKIALGPVGVFGASNFPILYSVAGGDTASALAAGCPVICKAHPSHLGTSELVGRAIREAVVQHGLPEGVFSLVVGAGNAVGEALVDHPEIKAIAFTGSEAGGMAIYRRGQQRPEPIPVFAEMTSINPHFLLPGAQAKRAQIFATRFVEQMVAGAGQMCLKPGLILAIEGNGYRALRATLIEKLSAVAAQTMLSPSVHANYERGVERHRHNSAMAGIAVGLAKQAPYEGQACLFEISAADALTDMIVLDEVFGPAAVLIRCRSPQDMRTLAARLPGQLSIVVHLEDEDIELARELMPTFERRTGRIVANSFSNIVEICDAQIHGGPFPATTDPRFTSVGSSAIDRFLRPIAYQDLPAALLPPALRDENPLGLWRLTNRNPTHEGHLS